MELRTTAPWGDQKELNQDEILAGFAWSREDLNEAGTLGFPAPMAHVTSVGTLRQRSSLRWFRSDVERWQDRVARLLARKA